MPLRMSTYRERRDVLRELGVEAAHNETNDGLAEEAEDLHDA